MAWQDESPRRAGIYWNRQRKNGHLSLEAIELRQVRESNGATYLVGKRSHWRRDFMAHHIGGQWWPSPIDPTQQTSPNPIEQAVTDTLLTLERQIKAVGRSGNVTLRNAEARRMLKSLRDSL